MPQYHLQTSAKAPAVKDIPATRTSAVETSSFTPKHPRFVVCEKQVVFADFFQVVFAEHNFLIEASCAEKEISSDFFFFPTMLVFQPLRLSAPAGYTSFESTLKRWSLHSDIRKDDKQVHC